MTFRKHLNTLFFKITVTVIIGILCLTIALCVVNIRVSKEVFVDHFVESQDKIFDQIDANIYKFFQDVGIIISGINRNQAVHDYLTRDDWDDVEERANILALIKYLEQLPLSDYNDFSLVLLGLNGRTYNYNTTAKLILSVEQILESEPAAKAMNSPNKLICEYRDGGFTDVMRNQPVIIMAKAITQDGGKNIDGLMLLTIKEKDFNRFYRYFTSGTSDIVIFNPDDEVISSSDDAYLTDAGRAKEVRQIITEMKENGTRKLIETNGSHVKNYMMQKLQSSNYTMLGIIKPDEAFDDAYDISYIVGLTVLIAAVVSMLIFFFVKQQTTPLSDLVRHMKHVQKNGLDNFMKVEGTTETRELSSAYNSMLVELDHYIQELVHAEQEKRKAEIHSLQTQINPHYIYNTLASVKWLIWQGDKDKSVRVIDAFIELLRNTISNKNEFITVRHEIENLKNYVLINQIRYGSQVNVEYYVSLSCEEQKVPKLILQPFVENAFFHAFPEARQGTIAIYVKDTENFIRFEIMDNGVGMDYQKLVSLQNRKDQKSEHFTGIGVTNVDDRIKLIYGNDYGINITSEKGKGTTIVILLPKRAPVPSPLGSP